MTRWLLFSLSLLTIDVHADEVAVGRGLRGAPAVAAGIDQFVVVWTDGVQLQARRFTGDGQPLDPEPLAIAESADARIAVAFDGLDYLIVWGDTNGVTARFLFSGATFPLSRETSAIAPPVAVAWNGVDFVVVWGRTTSVEAALIRADAGVVQSVLIDSGFQFVIHVSVSTGIDRNLILYAGQRGAFATLDAQIVDRNLTWMTAVRVDTLQTASGCLGGRAITGPNAIWTGSDWMVTWVQSSCFLGESNLLARMSRGGTLSSQRVVAPMNRGIVRSHLLPVNGEPALLTQFLRQGQPNEPVFLHLLSRGAAPRAILPPVTAFAATMLAANRLVLVYSGGEGVMATIESIDLPVRMRRRAVR